MISRKLYLIDDGEVVTHHLIMGPTTANYWSAIINHTLFYPEHVQLLARACKPHYQRVAHFPCLALIRHVVYRGPNLGPSGEIHEKVPISHSRKK